MKVLLLLCALALNIFSINVQIKGKILDGKTMMPLQGVNIYLQQDSVAIGISNQQGEFKITHSNRISPKDTIVFSYVGYHAVKCTPVDLEKLGNQIIMNESSQLLNEITVSGTQKSYYLDVEYLSSLPGALYSYGGFLLNGDIYTVAGDETIVQLVSGKSGRAGTEAWEFRSSDIFVYNVRQEVIQVIVQYYI